MMNAEQLAALLPLALLGLGGVAAMLAAPLRPGAAPGLAALAHLAAAWAMASRLDSAAAGTLLLADDGLARAGLLFASLAGLAILALPRVGREAPALITLASAGAAAAAAANHAASLVVALETTTLAIVALAAAPRGRVHLEAAIKLLVPAGMAAAAMLMAFALAMAGNGRLDLAAITATGPLSALSGALLLFGLAFKFALVPAHLWVPDLFDGAPASAAAVAGLLSKAAVGFVLLRLMTPLPQGQWMAGALALLGGASVLAGSLIALRQERLPRLLGWSSIAQSGFLALLIATGRGNGVTAAFIFVIVAYAPALLAALAVGVPLAPADGRVPALPRGAMLLALMSLAGLPAAGGFIAKLLIIRELMVAGAWVAVAFVILGSALGFVAYFRFLRALPAGVAEPAPPVTTGILVGSAALIVGIGVVPGPLAALAAALAAMT